MFNSKAENNVSMIRVYVANLLKGYAEYDLSPIMLSAVKKLLQELEDSILPVHSYDAEGKEVTLYQIQVFFGGNAPRVEVDIMLREEWERTKA
jgi:hypothetical protein